VMSPVPPIAELAAGLGHAHLKVDHDGVVRSTHLPEPVDERTLPQFSRILLDVGNAHAPTSLAARSADAVTTAQQQDYLMIPYAGPVGHFYRISAIDVIRGVFPEGTF